MEDKKLFILQQVLMSIVMVREIGFHNCINLINLYTKLLLKVERQMVVLDHFKMNKVYFFHLVVQLKFNLYKYVEKAIKNKRNWMDMDM